MIGYGEIPARPAESAGAVPVVPLGFVPAGFGGLAPSPPGNFMPPLPPIEAFSPGAASPGYGFPFAPSPSGFVPDGRGGRGPVPAALGDAPAGVHNVPVSGNIAGICDESGCDEGCNGDVYVRESASQDCDASSEEDGCFGATAQANAQGVSVGAAPVSGGPQRSASSYTVCT